MARETGVAPTATFAGQRSAGRNDVTPSSGDDTLVSRLPIPLDRAAQPILERRVRAKSKIALRTRRVQRTTRLTVRFRRVPHDLASESGEASDRLHQIPDRDLEAGAEVYGFFPVVAFRGQHECFGGVGRV